MAVLLLLAVLIPVYVYRHMRGFVDEFKNMIGNEEEDIIQQMLQSGIHNSLSKARRFSV